MYCGARVTHLVTRDPHFAKEYPESQRTNSDTLGRDRTTVVERDSVPLTVSPQNVTTVSFSSSSSRHSLVLVLDVLLSPVSTLLKEMYQVQSPNSSTPGRDRGVLCHTGV